MSPDLDKKLCETYPLLFRDRHGDMRGTAMCWGFEVGDGWYALVDSLCALICWPYESARQEYHDLRKMEGSEPFEGAEVASAVDVERARLAMTEAQEALPVAVQVKEKYGRLRFYVHGSNAAIDHYIDFAEYHSSKVCEQCGAPGQLRDRGWLSTLCDVHATRARVPCEEPKN